MTTIEERAKEYADLCVVGECSGLSGLIHCVAEKAYFAGGHEQKVIDKELIDELIGELYTSRAYHLEITGLDSKEEIARKEKEGDCALIRGIDRTIKYVKEAMEE